MGVDGYDGPLRAAAEAAGRFLEGAPTRPIRPEADRAALQHGLGGPLPEQPTAAEEVVDALIAGVEPGILLTQSPRFFGFVIGGTHPVALAADWLTSTWDQNACMYSAAPAASVVQHTVARWLLELFDLPAQSAVGSVTGGQMATWTCLAAARHQVLADAGWNVERQGLHAAPAVHVVAGAERHGTVDRAVRFLGIGTDRIVPVEVDDQGRMRADDLGVVLQRVEGPTIVVAEAGNVNSGAFDPIADIVSTARDHGAWVHVDGAFGLWARASDRRRHLADGVDTADSWSVDAHKWLNVPYDSGFAITRHAGAHRAALGHEAAYLVLDDEARYDAMNWTPEHSRRGREFAVWAMLRTLGRRGVAELVDRLCDRAAQFADALAAVEGVEVLNEVVLNQVLVRFGAGEDTDQQTRDVLARVQEDGTCWMSGTTWRGQAAMRISVSNWATSPEDVERSVAAILDCAGLGDRARG